MRGEAFEGVNGQGSIVVVATRDERLAAQVLALDVGPDVKWRWARTRREVEQILLPPHRLPHESKSGAIGALVLGQEIDSSAACELVGEILRRRPNLKIIFVARDLDPRVEMIVRQQGVYFIAPAPVHSATLRCVIAKAVEHETTRIKRVRRAYA